MPNKKYNSLLIIITTALMLLVLFEICEQNKAKHSAIMHEEQFFKEEFSGILEKKTIAKGYIQIVLKSNNDYQTWILKPSRNHNFSPSSLYDFLLKKDSLYKKPNSLILTIFRNHQVYTFELGKNIEKGKGAEDTIP